MPSRLKTTVSVCFCFRAVVAALVTAWALVIAAGFIVVVRYSYASGAVGEVVEAPAEAPIHADAARHTLVVAAHPHCPCTRATMSELERLAPLIAADVRMRVLLFIPAGEAKSWADGAIRSAAERLPNATIEFDRNGDLARSFGALTSGHIVLIAPDGRCVFRGGLTIARGHEGASVGRRAILDWIRHGDGATEAPVFGCALFDSAGDSSNGAL